MQAAVQWPGQDSNPHVPPRGFVRGRFPHRAIGHEKTLLCRGVVVFLTTDGRKRGTFEPRLPARERPSIRQPGRTGRPRPLPASLSLTSTEFIVKIFEVNRQVESCRRARTSGSELPAFGIVDTVMPALHGCEQGWSHLNYTRAPSPSFSRTLKARRGCSISSANTATTSS